MDLNPLIPNATTSHDIAHILSESFEDTIKSYILPSEISENLRKNNVDQDYLLFQKYGYEVKQVIIFIQKEMLFDRMKFGIVGW